MARVGIAGFWHEVHAQLMKFLHAADLHLDSPLRGLERYEGAPVEEIRGATRCALEAMVELALGEAVSLVAIAGDLFDGDWKDYNTGLYFCRQMGRLAEAEIPVFIVAGNHDAANQITKALRPPPNVQLLSSQAPQSIVLEGLGVAVHGQGFATRSVSEDLSCAYPMADRDLFNIGLLHTSLDGRACHAPYAPCTLDGLRNKGYQYWALGHVHQREIVARDPWVIYPGNTQGRHVGETGAKGCTLVTVEEGRVRAIEHRELDLVRWAVRRIDARSIAAVDELYDRVAAELKAAVVEADGRTVAVRLHLLGASPLHGHVRARSEHVLNECRALANVFGAGRLWVEKVLIDTRQAASEEGTLTRDDALGGLLRSVRGLQLDDERMTAFRAELAELRGKLPPQLRIAAEGLDPTDARAVEAALEDAKELLIERLLGGDDAS